jgi:enoyl-CoA hydratase/carnithine racemase
MTRSIPTTSPRLVAEVVQSTATVTISASERRNCIDLITWKAIPALFTALDADTDVRVVILTGAGDKAFCAGADIAEFDTERATAAGSRAYEQENVRAFNAVSAISKPVVAVIHGFCFGAGVGLAAACDLRLAADDAIFAIPAALLGVGYPPTALRSLVALMGPEATKNLFFSAGRLTASQALSVGLVGSVHPKEELDPAAAKLAQAIASGAPMTVMAAKRAIDAAAGSSGALPMEKLQQLADACFASQDYAEGRAAFKDKRKPLFRGR